MDKYKKRNKKHINLMKYVPSLMALIIILVTIGYSTYTDNFLVSNMEARVMIQKVIRLTGFKVLSVDNGATTSYNQYSFENAVAGVNLPNANSTVTFQVQVTNLGNVEMGIQEITGIPSNMEASLVGYTLEATLCDSNNNSKCTLGSVTTFYMTIGYKENGYNSNNTIYDLDMLFDFEEMIYTARIGNTYYETIQDAIDAAPTDHTETTIVLLKNTYQRIKIWAGNNIVLDMPNLVLHNKEITPGTSGDPVVEIFGTKTKTGSTVNNTATFKITNGTIMSESNQAAINCEKGSTFIMTGGTIVATGNRQAVYIRDGASAMISGSSYLKARAAIDLTPNKPPNYRGTVHVVNGSVTITGGTIESDGGGGIALTNESVATIGVKDGSVSTSVPTFIGTSIGANILSGTTFNYYDGIFKGKDLAIQRESEIDDKETGYNIVHSAQTINNNIYDTAYLSQESTYTITLDPRDGVLLDTTRRVAIGSTVGPLPVPTRDDYTFQGWYTANNDLVSASTQVTGNETYHAEWTPVVINYAAQIDDTKYLTLAAAVAAVPANTEKTIELLENRNEKVTIASNQIIVFDFGSYTLKNPDSGVVITNNGTLTLISGTISTTSSSAVITNNGTFTMTDGMITSSASSTAAINNSAGATLNMSGGSIIATGQRQAIYDSGGTVRISGTAYLSASAKVESSKQRGTVQNDNANSNIIITGGTIVSTANNGIGVTNIGTLTVGVKDGNISTISPVIRGKGKGINNTNILNFYDGILQSKGTPLSGSTTDIEDNSTPDTGTESIGGETYNTWYLVSTN